uniref:Gsp_07 putative toxin n=1 Tax=Gemmula speciosa TaxID=439592 RepID=A0A098LWD2_GEMSP
MRLQLILTITLLLTSFMGYRDAAVIQGKTERSAMKMRKLLQILHKNSCGCNDDDSDGDDCCFGTCLDNACWPVNKRSSAI